MERSSQDNERKRRKVKKSTFQQSLIKEEVYDVLSIWFHTGEKEME